MSKRIIKNIIMILLIIVLAVAMYFTAKPQQMRFNPNNKEMFEKNLENGKIPQKSENVGFSNMPEDERPAMLEGFELEEISEKQNNDFERRENVVEFTNKMFIFKMIVVSIEGLTISALSIYLIFSKFNKLNLKETFENTAKIGNFVAYVILITIIIVMFSILINKSSRENFEMTRGNGMMMPFEEEIEKATKKEDVEEGEKINTEIINLSEHTSNITITEAGNYTLTGEFGYTVLIDSKGDVVLNLDNAKIDNKLTAALANISTNPLTINLLDGTNNSFSDGGSSEYDACVYSAGPLTIKGNGSLEVYGNQEEGEGIATETNSLTIDGGNIKITSNDDGLNAGGDGGTIKINDGIVYIKANGDGIDSNKNIVINGGEIYTMGSSKGGDAGVDADDGTTINGGSLIALGSDMLEKPLNDSKQKVIVQNLKSVIEAGNKIILKDASGNEILSFTPDDSFKTIIISNPKLAEGKYNLYKGEELIAELECK